MTDDRALLEKELGFALPADARVLLVEQESGMDDMVRAKLQMSEAAFEQLEPSLPVRADAMTRGAGRLGTDKGEWNPHATPGLRSGQAPLPGSRYMNVGVARGDGGQVTVFIMSHGT
jgi:hypothetical protein